MNETESTHESLKRLLKLKRHEVPPPGYFDHFSASVLSRLRAGEVEGVQVSASWLVRLLQVFETKPGLIGGFATSLCLLLVLGVVFAERSDSDFSSNNLMSLAGPGTAGAPLASVTVPPLPVSASSVGIVASTNLVTSLQPVATLFGQPSPTLLQAPSFVPAGAGN